MNWTNADWAHFDKYCTAMYCKPHRKKAAKGKGKSSMPSNMLTLIRPTVCKLAFNARCSRKVLDASGTDLREGTEVIFHVKTNEPSRAHCRLKECERTELLRTNRHRLLSEVTKDSTGRM